MFTIIVTNITHPSDAMISGQEPGNFHIIILNDNLEKAYSELREFIALNTEEKERGLWVFCLLIND